MKPFITCMFQPIVDEVIYGAVARGAGIMLAALMTGGYAGLRSFLAVLGLAILTQSGHAAQKPLAEINTFAQLKALTPEVAATGLPVKISAVVICSDTTWGQLYFHDGEQPYYTAPVAFPQTLELSQHVQISGITCVHEGGPSFTNQSASVIGRKDLPSPKKVSVADLPKLPGAWVEITGVVRAAETSRTRLGLVIRDRGHPCTVYVMGESAVPDFRQFEGCQVRIRAINGSVSKRGSTDMPMVFAPAMSAVAVLQRPKDSPSAAPVMSMEAVLDREFGEWTNNVVHVSGLVASFDPGQSVAVRGSAGLLRANVIQVTPVQIGARVNLWGYLLVTPNGPILDDAYFEEARYSSQPAAPAISTSPQSQRAALTNIGAVFGLTREEQQQRVPVRIHGCITYADPFYQNHFVQDGSDAIYFVTTQTNLKAGQYVEIQAETDPGGFNPQLINARVTVLGVTNLPRAIGVELDDLALGNLDSHWIELDGIVRRAAVENDHLQLTVITPKGKFSAVVPGVPLESCPTNLVDSAVRLSGACASFVNPRGQLVGINLQVPSLEHIKIVVPAAEDVFAAESAPIGTVATYDSKRLVGHRVKVVGTITFCVPGDSIYLQDNTGGIRVKTRLGDDFRVGDKLEVLGFPALGEFSPQLEEPILRKVGSGDSITPQVTTADAILRDGGLDGRLIQIDAQLVQTVRPSARPRLALQQGATIFLAQLSSMASGDRLVGLESGSVLRLKGVCNVQAGDNREPEAFRLLLANAKDVQVLKRPSWLTPGRLITLAGILTFAVAGTLGWVSSLRRQVRAQTEVIRQKLEERQEFAEKLAREKQLLSTLMDHLPDQVFARDSSRRYLLANRSYTQFHGLPTHEYLVGKTPEGLLKGTAAANAATLDEQVLRGGAKLLQAFTELENADGNLRWIHTTRVPLKDEHGNVVGVVGISRDVTEAKRAEEELEKIHQRLQDTSRQAGMAEVATSVLHNVGNVLNSVNVSAGVISEQVRESRIQKVAEVAALLEHNRHNLCHFVTEDPRGRHLPGYLRLLGEHLTQGQSVILHELEGLTRNIEHIKEIVAMQQSYARVRGVLETVAVTDLVEDALKMNAGALERHHLQVKREYDARTLPRIAVEKHKVLQILVNLIRNAKYACDESGHPDKVLTVRVSNSDNSVKVSIEDNGVGIAPENLTKIFNHGFTTRASGHGFGLHSGALAAKEMSGALSAHSDGLGKGARFTLELPITPPSV